MLKWEIESKEQLISSKEQNIEFKWKTDITSKVEKDRLISDLQSDIASL